MWCGGGSSVVCVVCIARPSQGVDAVGPRLDGVKKLLGVLVVVGRSVISRGLWSKLRGVVVCAPGRDATGFVANCPRHTRVAVDWVPVNATPTTPRASATPPEYCNANAFETARPPTLRAVAASASRAPAAKSCPSRYRSTHSRSNGGLTIRGCVKCNGGIMILGDRTNSAHQADAPR